MLFKSRACSKMHHKHNFTTFTVLLFLCQRAFYLFYLFFYWLYWKTDVGSTNLQSCIFSFNKFLHIFRLSLTFSLCFFPVRFTLHHHFLRCLFCREQDIHMHRVYGRWVYFSLLATVVCKRLGLGQPCVSFLSIHLHFCRSRECLIALSCLACLCAKSYKGVINLHWSAFVGVFVRVCLHWCEIRDRTFLGVWACLSKCVLMQQFPCFTLFPVCHEVCITFEYFYFMKLYFLTCPENKKSV